MSVTQNYKTVTMSSDAHLHAVIAVMTQLRADRAVKRTPGDEYDKFLVDQITTGTEALAALNAATSANTAIATVVLTRMPGALEGEMLDTVLSELHAIRKIIVAGYAGLGPKTLAVTGRTDIEGRVGAAMARLDRLDAALLFLESPK